VEDHLAYLELLLEEAGDPWIVLGHSMGCPLAVEAARRASERIQAVVLFNAALYSSPERRREIFGRQNVLTRTSTRSRTLGRILCEASCLLRPIRTRLGPVLRPDLPAVSADYFRHRWHSYDRSSNTWSWSAACSPTWPRSDSPSGSSREPRPHRRAGRRDQLAR
jgi:pimeloyl-ACP methyl ester carboxylesterase